MLKPPWRTQWGLVRYTRWEGVKQFAAARRQARRAAVPRGVPQRVRRGSKPVDFRGEKDWIGSKCRSRGVGVA